MATGRPRDQVKERQWRRWLEEQQGSGSSVRAFCRRRGLPEQAFYQWRRTLAARAPLAPRPAQLFVPVEVVQSDLDSRIEIVLSAAPTNDYLDLWRGLLRDAANPRHETRPPTLRA